MAKSKPKPSFNVYGSSRAKPVSTTGQLKARKASSKQAQATRNLLLNIASVTPVGRGAKAAAAGVNELNRLARQINSLRAQYRKAQTPSQREIITQQAKRAQAQMDELRKTTRGVTAVPKNAPSREKFLREEIAETQDQIANLRETNRELLYIRRKTRRSKGNAPVAERFRQQLRADIKMNKEMLARDRSELKALLANKRQPSNRPKKVAAPKSGRTRASDKVVTVEPRLEGVRSPSVRNRPGARELTDREAARERAAMMQRRRRGNIRERAQGRAQGNRSVSESADARRIRSQRIQARRSGGK